MISDTTITLREWTLNDIDDLVKYANEKEIAANLTDAFPHPYTRENAIQFLERVNNQDPVLIYAIDLNGKAIGSIGIHPQSDIYRRNAELGYWLALPYHGRGIMTDAIKLMTTKAFDLLDIDRIFAKPFGRNIGSQKVLEKAGFQLEARLNKTLIKNGQLEDELIYSFRL